MPIVWTDNPYGLDGKIPVANTNAVIGDANNRLNTLFVKTVDALEINLDSLEINYPLTAYAAGTAYALTATSAVVALGTTPATLVLDKAGTYLITSRVNLELAAATFAANRDVTLKLRRTNNTAADVSNSATVVGTGVTTTETGVLVIANLPGVLYTTTRTDDSLSIFADVSVIPTAGALNATEANIVAIRLY